MYSLFTNKNNTIALYGVIGLIGTVSLTACQQTPDYNYLSGETMGTSYHISYQLPDDVDETAIQAAIDKRLQDINDSMSTYQADSTISKFNQLGKDTPIAIDSDFSHVLEASRQVYQQSGGAFDPTVMPLIETWGFGSTMTVERLQSPPTALDIAQAKALVDFESVVQNDNGLIKTKDGIELDFSAVAKATELTLSLTSSKTTIKSVTIWLRLVVKLRPLASITNSNRGKLRLMPLLKAAPLANAKRYLPFVNL